MILTRKDQIDAAFRKFHEKNPIVWQLFERFALEAARRRSHFSAYAIFERIRWYTGVETVDNDGVKINNTFRPCYARMFEEQHPELQDFFHTRVRNSVKRKPSPNPQTVFIDEPEDGSGIG